MKRHMRTSTMTKRVRQLFFYTCLVVGLLILIVAVLIWR